MSHPYNKRAIIDPEKERKLLYLSLYATLPILKKQNSSYGRSSFGRESGFHAEVPGPVPPTETKNDDCKIIN